MEYKTPSVKWKNCLNHLINLLLLLGNASPSLSNNNLLSFHSNSTTTTATTTMADNFQQKKSATTFTSISNSNLMSRFDFMTSNFTMVSFKNGKSDIRDDDNRTVSKLLNSYVTNNTYQITNFNESNNTSNLMDNFVCLIKRIKRGGPRRIKNQQKIMKNFENKVNNSDFTLIKQNNHLNKTSSEISTKVSTKEPLKVSVLGLFELTSRSGLRKEGKSELAAAMLAVRHINERKFLDEYTLELITNDTQVSKYFTLNFRDYTPEQQQQS